MVGEDPEVGVFVGPDPILHERVSLNIIVEFVSRLGSLHVEAINETTLKHILQYWSFGLRRELILALARRWVPHKRVFNIRGGWSHLLSSMCC